MVIDRNLSPIEVHKAIYNHVRTLGIKHRFRLSDDVDEKWYRDSNEGPFLLFPHASIDDPEKAINTSPYPNIWIRHNPESGELEYGIAFWSAAAVDERFVNFTHNTNENQRQRVLSILKGLPDNWQFRVYKKKKQVSGEVVFESLCNKMGEAELTKVVSDVLAWRVQWKKESTERGNVTTPAIHFMRCVSSPEDADKRLSEMFAVFDELTEMTPSKLILDDLKKLKKEMAAKVVNLTENLETSSYKREIESRLKNLRVEQEQVDAAIKAIVDSR
jgi:hypothetical protein